jgi:NTE family protein
MMNSRILPALGLVLGILPLLLGPRPAGAQPVAGSAAHRPKICLVLAGGGARGIAHVGVLKVLKSMRIPIDCVVGTSIGSIVGGALAAGLDADAIEDVVRKANWTEILSDQPPRSERTVYEKAIERQHAVTAELGLNGTSVELPRGILVGHGLQIFLRRIVPDGTDLDFDALPVPYRAIATDFETGAPQVLDHGDMALAIRASMSVPGAFAPVTVNGRLLVDGGLVQNLPVEAARQFKPDVVIAVDLGTQLLKREELKSLLAAGLQTLNILMAQNIERSRLALGPRDIVIAPDVADVSPADFPGSMKAIDRGVAAALAVADQLSRYSVSEAEYSAWTRAHGTPRPATRYARVTVDTSRLKVVPAESVLARFGTDATPADVDARIERLMGTGDFERVDVHTDRSEDGDVLTIRPVEKSWGPDYLRAGIALGADLGGGSDFTVFLHRRKTWLNSRGLEWRLNASVGRVNSLVNELRQPLSVGRDWFVSGVVGAANEQRNLYLDDFPISTYRLTIFNGYAGIGRSFGNFGEFVAGAGIEDSVPRFYNGVPLPGLDSPHETATVARARFTSDTYDNLDFPLRGHQLRLDADVARQSFGGHYDYERLAASASQAFGFDADSLVVTARYMTSLHSTLPLYRQFDLGGFLNLSGLRQFQILANRVTFASVVFRHRLLEGGDILPGLYIGGSLEAADVRDRYNPFTDLKASGEFVVRDERIGAGSLFLSAQSALGPFYFAVGRSKAGQTSVYLYFGRP